MKANVFRGATAWEGYIGCLWFRWPFWAYIKCGCWPKIGWDNGKD